MELFSSKPLSLFCADTEYSEYHVDTELVACPGHVSTILMLHTIYILLPGK